MMDNNTFLAICMICLAVGHVADAYFSNKNKD